MQIPILTNLAICLYSHKINKHLAMVVVLLSLLYNLHTWTFHGIPWIKISGDQIFSSLLISGIFIFIQYSATSAIAIMTKLLNVWMTKSLCKLIKMYIKIVKLLLITKMLWWFWIPIYFFGLNCKIVNLRWVEWIFSLIKSDTIAFLWWSENTNDERDRNAKQNVTQFDSSKTKVLLAKDSHTFQNAIICVSH